MSSEARGLYSKEAIAGGSSTVWYLMADGTEQELTAVDRPEEYLFADVEDRGKPVKWLRDGRPGTGRIVILDQCPYVTTARRQTWYL